MQMVWEDKYEDPQYSLPFQRIGTQKIFEGYVKIECAGYKFCLSPCENIWTPRSSLVRLGIEMFKKRQKKGIPVGSGKFRSIFCMSIYSRPSYLF